MAITFDAANKRIILDSTSVTVSAIWQAWVVWHSLSDNSKWPAAFSQVGGDDLGGGLSIPLYFFLQNGWRVRPMESNHSLVITGNLFVQEGGIPVVNTLGSYNVSVQYTVPVQAQGIATGGSTGPSATDIATAVWGWLIENGISAEKSLKLMSAVLLGKTTGSGTSTENFIGLDGVTTRVTTEFDSSGNRTTVTLDGD